jgi:hypothetical protein
MIESNRRLVVFVVLLAIGCTPYINPDATGNCGGQKSSPDQLIDWSFDADGDSIDDFEIRYLTISSSRWIDKTDYYTQIVLQPLNGNLICTTDSMWVRPISRSKRSVRGESGRRHQLC